MVGERAPITRRVALGVLVAGGVAWGVREIVGDQEHPPSHAATGQPASRRHRVLFGAWQPGGQASFRALERRLGRRLDIEHWYQGWGVPVVADRYFDVDRARTATARGTIPMVTWEPWNYLAGRTQPTYALRRIVAGRFDAYIRANARRMATVRGPVWVRFAHEANAGSYPWAIGVNGTTARQYVLAWRRIVRLFRSEGANNVRFIWSINAPSPGSTPPRRIFPGDGYVSYVGIDSYNFGGAGWITPRTAFLVGYQRLRRLSRRPVVITETGTASRGGNKANWIRNLGTTLRRGFPGVSAVVWFNQRAERDWRLDATAASLAAARATFRRAPFN